MSYGLQINGANISGVNIGLRLVKSLDPLEHLGGMHYRGKKNISLDRSSNHLSYMVKTTEPQLDYDIGYSSISFTTLNSSTRGIVRDYRGERDRGIRVNTKIYEVLDMRQKLLYGLTVYDKLLNESTIQYLFDISRIYHNGNQHKGQPTYTGNVKSFDFLAVKKVNQSFNITGGEDWLSWNNWGLELFGVKLRDNTQGGQYGLKVGSKVVSSGGTALSDFVIFENDFYSFIVEDLDPQDSGGFEEYENSLNYSYNNGAISGRAWSG